MLHASVLHTFTYSDRRKVIYRLASRVKVPTGARATGRAVGQRRRCDPPRAAPLPDGGGGRQSGSGHPNGSAGKRAARLAVGPGQAGERARVGEQAAIQPSGSTLRTRPLAPAMVRKTPVRVAPTMEAASRMSLPPVAPPKTGHRGPGRHQGPGKGGTMRHPTARERRNNCGSNGAKWLSRPGRA